MTRQDYRGIGGVGEETAPPFTPSRSEGDMSRFSFRDSRFNRLTQRAVCNDDGSPIADGTNALLLEIRDLLKQLLEK